MALLPSTHHRFLLQLLLYIYICSCNFGMAFDYPHLGAAGVVADQYLPKAEGEGETDHFFPQPGIIGLSPSRIFIRALGCLKPNYIYNSCEEEHRLTESGELHVTPEYREEYCKGPCLKETKHALDCMNGILKGFVFLNRATLNDVRDTIESGCYGPKRGDFNVLEHIQADDGGEKKVYNAVYASVLMIAIAVWRLLL